MDVSPVGLVGYLTGPTAVGKTEVALLLAGRFRWSILSVDSRQVYRQLEIGTAKPTPEECRQVPHLLLNVLGLDEVSSAGRYRRLAEEALSELDRRGGRALAVGGAGLYWEALIQGLHDLPAASSEIRARHERIVEEEGSEALHRRLQAVDPDRAALLSPKDRLRVSRALEVYELTGRPMSRCLAGGRRGDPNSLAPEAGLPVIALLRDRGDLYDRIERRCRRMLEAGLVDELRRLLAEGVPADAPGLRTVGYREFMPHLIEGESLAPCIDRFVRNSRQYAKRQETWLRHRLPASIPVRVDRNETPRTTVERILALGIFQGVS